MIRDIKFYDGEGNLLAHAEYWGVVDMTENDEGKWVETALWDIAIVASRFGASVEEWDARTEGTEGDWVYLEGILKHNLHYAVGEASARIAYTVESP